jgi:hypothetical protein
MPGCMRAKSFKFNAKWAQKRANNVFLSINRELLEGVCACDSGSPAAADEDLSLHPKKQRPLLGDPGSGAPFIWERSDLGRPPSSKRQVDLSENLAVFN